MLYIVECFIMNIFSFPVMFDRGKPKAEIIFIHHALTVQNHRYRPFLFINCTYTPSLYHGCELLGKYHDFVRVMVSYLFCRRSMIILATIFFSPVIYIYIYSLIIFILKNHQIIFFLITMVHVYIYIDIKNDI